MIPSIDFGTHSRNDSRSRFAPADCVTALSVRPDQRQDVRHPGEFLIPEHGRDAYLALAHNKAQVVRHHLAQDFVPHRHLIVIYLVVIYYISKMTPRTAASKILAGKYPTVVHYEVWSLSSCGATAASAAGTNGCHGTRRRNRAFARSARIRTGTGQGRRRLKDLSRRRVVLARLDA
jgi:hypothetical protein